MKRKLWIMIWIYVINSQFLSKSFYSKLFRYRMTNFINSTSININKQISLIVHENTMYKHLQKKRLCF